MEKSCGCIIIKNNTVLLEKQKHEDERLWSFPKGHQETDETDIETAIRETKEEVGLDVIITDKNPITISYMVKNGTVKKTVLLFLAKLNPSHEEKIVLQEAEVEDARWASFDEAAELLTFELSKNAWAEARKRLNQ